MLAHQAVSNVASPSFDAAGAHELARQTRATSVFADDPPKNRLAALIRASIERSLPMLSLLWRVFLDRPVPIAAVVIVRDFDPRG